MKSNLVITRIPPHTKEWFDFRKNGIGGSEMSQVLGLDRYNTVVRLYHEKCGDLEPRQIDNSKMFFGRYLEDKIADLWRYWDGSSDGYIENYKNNKIIRDCRNVNGFIVNPDYPWLFGSLDRLINIRGGVNLLTGEALTTEAILECKMLSYWSSQLWQEGIPVSYLIQVHCYMIILETDYAELAILKDGNDFHVEKIQRDDVLCEKIIEISKGFWYNRVVPAKEAYAKMCEAHKAGNIFEAEKWEGEIQRYEPEPDQSEAYNEFINEKFLKTREFIEGTMELFDLAKQDKVLIGIKNIIDSERTGIKNKFLHEFEQSGADLVDFGKLGSVQWQGRKGAKNRTFVNYVKEKPTEDTLMDEFKKIDLNCY